MEKRQIKENEDKVTKKTTPDQTPRFENGMRKMNMVITTAFQQ